VPLGEGVIDLGAVLSSLQQSDFHGFVVIRPDCHEQNMEKIVYGSASYLEQAGFALRKTDHCPICSPVS
jgi:sugar phosphate isomerase/epimerase